MGHVSQTIYRVRIYKHNMGGGRCKSMAGGGRTNRCVNKGERTFQKNEKVGAQEQQ